MKIKIFFVLSLLFNAVFILFVVLSLSSKKSFLSFNKEDGYITAAAIVSVPMYDEIIFGPVEITLTQGQKAFLQFSFHSHEIRQGNVLVRALYDPDVISVADTGYGIEILAVTRGSTLMQTLTNDGIKDVALVIVK